MATAAGTAERQPTTVPEVGDDGLCRALTATFFGIFHRMRQDAARRAAEFDLSLAQVRALHAVREPLSMRELADRLFLDPSNLTALVDGLEDRDLVERTVDADDRRVKRIVLTERGVRLSGEIIDAVFAESPVFQELDVGEQRQLLDIMGRLSAQPES